MPKARKNTTASPLRKVSKGRVTQAHKEPSRSAYSHSRLDFEGPPRSRSSKADDGVTKVKIHRIKRPHHIPSTEEAVRTILKDNSVGSNDLRHARISEEELVELAHSGTLGAGDIERIVRQVKWLGNHHVDSGSGYYYPGAFSPARTKVVFPRTFIQDYIVGLQKRKRAGKDIDSDSDTDSDQSDQISESEGPRRLSWGAKATRVINKIGDVNKLRNAMYPNQGLAAPHRARSHSHSHSESNSDSHSDSRGSGESESNHEDQKVSSCVKLYKREGIYSGDLRHQRRLFKRYAVANHPDKVGHGASSKKYTAVASCRDQWSTPTWSEAED